MTDVLLAEFTNADALLAAARSSRDAGHEPLDVLTPFPIEEIEPLLRRQPNPIRPTMLVAGLATAALAYGLEWYSAVVDYPLHLGARPLDSWPVFVFMPFEVSILVAAVAGIACWLWVCGLPRLHHPLFAVPGIERATQDRFFLAVPAPSPAERTGGPEALLRSCGAVSLQRLVP